MNPIKRYLINFSICIGFCTGVIGLISSAVCIGGFISWNFVPIGEFMTYIVNANFILPLVRLSIVFAFLPWDISTFENDRKVKPSEDEN